MGQVGSSTGGRIATSIVGGIIAAPPAYLVGKIVENWGVLDPLAERIGGWLKVHVPPSAVAWAVGLIFFTALYGLFLRRIWRPRHIHHLPINSQTAPEASLEMQVIRASPKKPALTNVDKERCAEAFRDLHDFIGGNLNMFNRSLNIAGNAPTKLDPFVEALPALMERQERIRWGANSLYHRHAHYLDLVGLDAAPLLSSIEALRNPLAEAFKARDWPDEALKEKANAVAAANGEMYDSMHELLGSMKAKRSEYLNG